MCFPGSINPPQFLIGIYSKWRIYGKFLATPQHQEHLAPTYNQRTSYFRLERHNSKYRSSKLHTYTLTLLHSSIFCQIIFKVSSVAKGINTMYTYISMILYVAVTLHSVVRQDINIDFFFLSLTHVDEQIFMCVCLLLSLHKVTNIYRLSVNPCYGGYSFK